MHLTPEKTLRNETHPVKTSVRPLVAAALLALSLALAACEKKFTGEPQVFTCSDGARVEVIYSKTHDKALVRLGDKSYELARVSTVSGTKYSDGQVLFWNKGQGAIVEIDGRVAHDGCRLAE